MRSGLWRTAALLLSGAGGVSVCGAQVGQVTILAQNPPSDGVYTLASDGNLYTQGYVFNMETGFAAFPLPSSTFFQIPGGTFVAWGGSNCAITEVTLGGAASTLAAEPSCSIQAMIQGVDGNFYGVTSAGGTYSQGSVFQVTPAGTYATLYSFTGGPDGAQPQAWLLQGSDGNLYGTTAAGGTAGAGVFFKSSLTGSVQTIENASLPQLQQIGDDLFAGVQITEPNSAQLSYVSVSTDGTVATLGQITNAPNAIDEACSYSGANTLYCPLNLIYGGDANCNYTQLQGNTASGKVLQPVAFANCNYYYGGYNMATATVGGDGLFYGAYVDQGSDQSGTSTTTQLYSATGVDEAPISIAFDPPAIPAGGNSSTLKWTANGAYSDTAKHCFGSGSWSGAQPSTGSLTVSQSSLGQYRYALTCGGVKTAAATLLVGTTTTTISGPPIVVQGSQATYNATVAIPGSTVVPTGSVRFTVGNTVVGISALNAAGVATLTGSTANYPAGTYTLYAQYIPTTNFLSSASNVGITIIASKYSTTTQWQEVSPTSVSDGQKITLAAITSVYADGTVAFQANGVTVATTPIEQGKAQVTLTVPNYPSGTYQMTAMFTGTSIYAPSTSSAVAVTYRSTPGVSVSATPDPVPSGSTVTVSVTVASATGGPTPTGSVTLYSGTQYLGAASLSSDGTVNVQVSSHGIPAGTYQVTAKYAGDGNYGPATGTTGVVVQ